MSIGCRLETGRRSESYIYIVKVFLALNIAEISSVRNRSCNYLISVKNLLLVNSTKIPVLGAW